MLAGAGLTPEGVIRQLLERTAREGVVPLRKGRARPKRTDGGDAGAHFVQGDLFARPDPAEPFYSFNPPAAKPETLLPSLVTLRALQDAQAKLRWRERERESADGSMLQSGGLIISKCDSKYFIENSKPTFETLVSKYYEIVPATTEFTGYTAYIKISDFFNQLKSNFSEPCAILRWCKF